MRRPMTIIRALVVAGALLALAACEPTTPSPPPPAPNLEAMVEQVWAPGTLPRGSNVTWVLDVPVYNGETYAGLAVPTCFFDACTWTITIHPDYVNPWVVAHEGGHVECWAIWHDSSEACADAVADRMTGAG
jgi:hypothetical protein